jgi:hypothetical protein
MLELEWGEDQALAEEKTYQAEYVGSGTFIIRKPSRKPNKRRQLKLKSPRGGMRK